MRIFRFEHQGQRPKQEDSSYISDDRSLFLVCDGVGGSHNGGEASKAIVEIIGKQYSMMANADFESSLKRLVVQANYQLFELFNENKTASTTLVLVLIKEDKAFITHLGDSKIFYIDKTKHEWWVSKDHSLVQELFEAGILETEREMKSHPLRNRITLSMNSDTLLAEDEIKINVVPKVNTGDIFILCTDGVLENITSDEMADLFTNKPIEEAYLQLKSQCQENSKDNNTAIIIEV